MVVLWVILSLPYIAKVDTAVYLNNDLIEEIQMKALAGVHFNWLLFIKTLHGLKQTGRSWNLLLKGTLLSYGFIRISEDYCLLIYQYGGKMTITYIRR